MLKKNVHREASRIRDKWIAEYYVEKKFFKNHGDWLKVLFAETINIFLTDIMQ